LSRILFLSAIPDPFLEDHGGKQRLVRLLYQVAKKHEVTLLSLAWDKKSFEKHIAPNIRQISVPVEANIILRSKIFGTGLQAPNQDILISYYKKNIRLFVDKMNELSLGSDLIVVDHYAIGPLIERLTNREIPIYYLSQNCEVEMVKQSQGLDSKDVELVRKSEGYILKRANAWGYCSNDDLTKIKENYNFNNLSFYIPNGSKFLPEIRAGGNFNSKNILFIGSGHPPNLIAAKKLRDFAQNLPQYNFIIGGTCSSSLSRTADTKNVIIRPKLSSEEVDKLFSEAFIFVNPMESGSGTHLKMMKAISYGLPIVSSAVGARGFSSEEKKNCMLIADTFSDMKDSIESLSDEVKYKKMSLNCLELSKIYDWDIIGANFIDSIEETLSIRL